MVVPLEETMTTIDSLRGYGPIDSLYGLERWILHICSFLEHESALSINHAYKLAEHFFSRVPYSDNTRRSRVYHAAQNLLVKELKKTPQGMIVFQELQRTNPTFTSLYANNL